MFIRHEFAQLHELAKRRLLPHDIRTGKRFHKIEDFRFQDKKTAVDEIRGGAGFFIKSKNSASFVIRQMAKCGMRIDHRNCRKPSV